MNHITPFYFVDDIPKKKTATETHVPPKPLTKGEKIFIGVTGTGFIVFTIVYMICVFYGKAIKRWWRGRR